MNHTETPINERVEQAVGQLTIGQMLLILGDLCYTIIEYPLFTTTLTHTSGQLVNTPPVWDSLEPLKEALEANGLTIQEQQS